MSALLPITALIGPTASGKSDIALEVARRAGCEILSCDSLLIYRHFDVGTAKPSSEDRSIAIHHGIDLIEPMQNYTAADYVRYAEKILQEARARNKPVLIVGGTGFYLKALLYGVWDAPPTDENFRKELLGSVSHLAEEEKNQTLYRQLQNQDPDYAHTIHANDQYRVIRALEILHASGVKPSQIQIEKKQSTKSIYDAKIFGIQTAKATLETNIRRRTLKMFSEGFVAEVKKLRQEFGANLRPLKSVGYNEVMQFLDRPADSSLNLHECQEQIVIATRQLAKKQMTFFRSMDLDIHWHDLPSQKEALIEDIVSRLSAQGSR